MNNVTKVRTWRNFLLTSDTNVRDLGERTVVNKHGMLNVVLVLGSKHRVAKVLKDNVLNAIPLTRFAEAMLILEAKIKDVNIIGDAIASTCLQIKTLVKK